MKTSWWRRMAPVLGTGVLLVTAGCSGDATGITDQEPAALVTVTPDPGATDVVVDATVVVTFDHPLMAGMEAYADLHEGELTGPVVDGTWALSEDRMALTFTPASPLLPATTYVIHVGGGMTDAHGDPVDLSSHGPGMGGQWATGDMMQGGGGGMHGGSSGMGGQEHHMGEGWEHANGTYGMVFTFTTAG